LVVAIIKKFMDGGILVKEGIDMGPDLSAFKMPANSPRMGPPIEELFF
jgi:hypothetical protein